MIACIAGLTLADDHFAGDDRRQERLAMVREQIELEGVSHKPTLQAMREVPRHKFVPKRGQRYAYADRPLPIGYGQTISQPYVVGFMTAQLDPRPNHKALEIGTGSGYQAAILSKLVKEVYTLEIIEELAKEAEDRLKRDYRNVRVIHADGFHGWEAEAPYDVIIVTAAADYIPPPLVEQLKDGGRMIIPVGSPLSMQWLVLITRNGDELVSQRLLPVRFVPFTRERRK
jgi:protein-L-isoaspartate(D-aspartate) O-methyltransferase